MSKQQKSKGPPRRQQQVVSYDEAKNLKHLKDAHGHLMHFDGSRLSEWNRSLVDVARHNLGEAIQRICGK